MKNKVSVNCHLIEEMVHIITRVNSHNVMYMVLTTLASEYWANSEPMTIMLMALERQYIMPCCPQ